MSKIFRHFRLIAIATCVLAVLFLQLRSSYLVEFWKQAHYDQWKYNFRHTEHLISNLVRNKLYEPFFPVHNSVNVFVGSDTDVDGFHNWLLTRASEDSLIGAGFIWKRDIDSLIVIPLTTYLDSETKRNLKLFIDADNDPDLVGPPQPHWVYFYKDSLRGKINQKVGYQTYQYTYYNEFKTRRDRANATQTVLGIIWNHDYYRRAIIPRLTEEITKSPRKFGLPIFGIGSKTHHNGVLILDATRDTVFSLGNVDMQSEVLIWQNIFTGVVNWNSPDYHPMKYCPGWSLMIQDRRDWNYVSSGAFGDVALEALPGGDIENEDDHNEAATAAMTMLVGLLQPQKSYHLIQWLIAFLAVVALFLIITGQIATVRRQRNFIAHISHELRTPVSKVRLFAETLRNGRTVSENKENEYLDNILNASDNLTVLVDNALNLVRLDSGKFEVNLVSQDFRHWIEEFYASQKGFLVESGFASSLKIDPELPKISFDSDTMGMTLRNILDNSIKYSDQVKEIEICAVKKGANKVILSVSDRGRGIPDNKKKAIFRRFYRIYSKDREPIGGVGLGLSIVKEIVTAHRGKVWCENREGGGSTFFIEIPAD